MDSHNSDRFRVLAETARDIILTCDREGRVTFINRAGLDFLGCSAAGSSGMTLGDILPPAEVAGLHLGFLRVPGGSGSSKCRVVSLRASMGERRLGELSCALVPGEAAEAETLVQIRLIPGQRLEEMGCTANGSALRAGEEAVELETAVSDLTAFSRSVSHDLRSPLRTIQGAARILDGEHATVLDAEGRALLRMITQNAGEMVRLIDDILAFSRVGSQRLEKVRIDMNELAGAVFEGLAPVVTGREVAFDVSPLPPAVGDPGLVRQLLVNLLSNALKFTRPRREAVIRVGTLNGGGETAYFVSDNGVGFDMTYADKLFGVFQRLHHKDEFEGNGAGLAIARRIVSRHGGRIWAKGESGTGATFYFTL